MREILEILNKNGYEAYIVGGFVRDYLLGISSNDVDICTNAPIEEIMRIFKNRGKAYEQYYSYHNEEGDMTYDITTYREELKYKKNKPVVIKPAEDLGNDLLRRDFTINTFAVNSNGEFVDLLGSKRDLDQKLIRVVGDTEKKFTDDKTRILRAIRFYCTLDFDLSSDIINFFESGKGKLLNEVPLEYKKKELDKIFNSNNIDKFFYFVEKYKLDKYLNIEFDKVTKTYNSLGIWAQIETTLPMTTVEKVLITSIKAVISNGRITMDDLRKFSDIVILNAASILRQEDRVKELLEIKKLHSIIDIDFELDDFFDYVTPSEFVKTYRLVERRIMEGYLENNKEDLEDFLRML